MPGVLSAAAKQRGTAPKAAPEGGALSKQFGKTVERMSPYGYKEIIYPTREAFAEATHRPGALAVEQPGVVHYRGADYAADPMVVDHERIHIGQDRVTNGKLDAIKTNLLDWMNNEDVTGLPRYENPAYEFSQPYSVAGSKEIQPRVLDRLRDYLTVNRKTNPENWQNLEYLMPQPIMTQYLKKMGLPAVYNPMRTPMQEVPLFGEPQMTRGLK